MSSAGFRWSTTLLAAALLTVPVRAQAASTASTASTASDEADAGPPVTADGAETIHVAGRRRSSISGTKTQTPIGQNPQSISVVDRAQIEQQAAQDVPEALRYVPGVSAELAGDDNRIETNQILIRGFNPDEYLDGLRLQAGTWATPQLDAYDLERVDVVRGPDSVVYGQASPGGLVALASKRPTDTPFHEIVLTTGSYGRAQLGLDSSDAVNASGSVRYRVVGLFRDTDTQVDHTGLRRFLLAPSLTWTANPRTSVTVLTSVQADPEGGFYNQLPYAGTLLPDPYGRISTATYLGEPGYDRMHRNQLSLGYELEHRLNDAVTLKQDFRFQNVTANYDAITFDVLDSDLRTAERDSYTAREDLDTVALDNQMQIRSRLGSAHGTSLLGIDLQTLRWDDRAAYGYLGAAPIDIFAPVYTGFSGTVPTIVDQLVTERQLGFYGQQQIDWQRLHLVGGVRGDLFDEHIHNRLSDTRSSISESAVTGRVGALYTLPWGISPYADYSTSFRPQTGTTYTGATLSPTTGQQVELGIKLQPARINGFLTLAVYDLHEQNVATTDTEHTGFEVAAGEVRSRGVELEAHYDPDPNLRLLASYGFVDQTLTKQLDGFVGTALPGVPRQTASAWGLYTIHAGPLAGFGFGGGVRYQGISFANDANTDRVPDVVLLDLQMHYDLGARLRALHGFSAQLNVSNLADRIYIASCGDLGCEYGLRRTTIASLRYRW